jgi:hypothetical protein
MLVRRGQSKLLNMHHDNSVDRSKKRLLLVLHNAVTSSMIVAK